MDILAVLDLLRGQVVRGVAGRRHEYQPVVSRLTASAEPLAIARAFRDHLGLTHLYLADLDAIAGSAPASATYAELQREGFRLWVDAGLRLCADARPLAAVGVAGIVAGLETLEGPDTLGELCDEYGPGRIVFSLDLKGGKPLGNPAWGEDAWAVVARAAGCGVARLIVLDLERVGVGSGTGTEALCQRLVETYPELEVIAGGGVRDGADLERLPRCGVRGVLVASALHDGRLTRADLATL
ncbi:MAG: HisA/HisF-related TIM barrel protein [Gemmataceae bacterium]|nr:HisA/HisF-related TIM barrel protein [Gemmataceae bacterium]